MSEEKKVRHFQFGAGETFVPSRETPYGVTIGEIVLAGQTFKVRKIKDTVAAYLMRDAEGNDSQMIAGAVNFLAASVEDGPGFEQLILSGAVPFADITAAVTQIVALMAEGDE